MAMSREQAEKLLAADPELARRYGSRERAIIALMRENAEARPQSAIAAGVLGEQPTPVTPASPAPMKPGVPVMAPRPEAAQLPAPAANTQLDKARAVPPPAPPAAAPAPAPSSEAAPAPDKKPNVLPERVAAQQAERDLAVIVKAVEDIEAAGKEAPAELKVRLQVAQRKAQITAAEADAVEAAQINPEIAKILGRQEQGIEEERARLAADKARAPWEALTAGGLALMNPQKGANFLAALGQGLGVGLEAYDTTRAQAAERKARLNKEFDQVALQRIDALDKARQAARDAIRRGDEVDARTLQMAKLTREEIIGQGTQQAAIDLAVANAKKAQTEERFAAEDAQSIIDLRRAQAAAARDRGSGGGDGGPTPTSILKAQRDAERKASDLRIKAANAFAEWKDKTGGTSDQASGPLWDKYDALRREYRYWRDKAGRTTPYRTKGSPAAKPAASSKPSLRYDPKTGNFVSS